MNSLPYKIIAWYDREIRLWTAIYADEQGYQQGSAGYGTTKRAAVEDVKYQADIAVDSH